VTTAKKKDPAVARLEEIDTMFVSLVDRGANRQNKFFVVKADGKKPEPVGKGVAMELGKEAMETLMERFQTLKDKMDSGSLSQDDIKDAFHGQWQLEELIRQAVAVTAKSDTLALSIESVLPALKELAKQEDNSADKATCPYCNAQVEPGASMCPKCGKPLKAGQGSDEQKAAQKDRAEKYGIEILAEEKSHVVAPAKSPTTEELYGDPVNFQFPLGCEKDETSKEVVGTSLLRFKRNYREYEEKSRTVVAARIVRAALSASVVMELPESVAKLLPEDLLEEYKKSQADGSSNGSDDNRDAKGKDDTDMSSWLDEAGGKVQSVLMDVKVRSALDAHLESDGVELSATGKRNVRVGVGGGAPSGDNGDVQELREKNAKLEAQLKKARKELRVAKAKLIKSNATIGSSTALLTGEEEAELAVGKGNSLSWAGDLAQDVEEDE